MIPFFVAAIVYKNPCANIDPDSWAWIFSGCWLIGRQQTVLVIGLAITMALLAATALRTLRQRFTAA